MHFALLAGYGASAVNLIGDRDFLEDV